MINDEQKQTPPQDQKNSQENNIPLIKDSLDESSDEDKVVSIPLAQDKPSETSSSSSEASIPLAQDKPSETSFSSSEASILTVFNSKEVLEVSSSIAKQEKCLETKSKESTEESPKRKRVKRLSFSPKPKC